MGRGWSRAYLGPIHSSLTPLDIATCIPIGSVENPEPLPHVWRGQHPLQALEDAVRPALLRPPCVVSFSGGRDSSAVLAVTTRLARGEGHPLPVPVTMRFPDAKDTEEAEWQALVVRHLALPDWQKLDFTDELDLLGPVSTGVLRRHGLLWPPNAYAHVVIVREASGGSVLTGLDGDGVFGSWRYSPLSQLRHAQVRPTRGHLRLAAAAVAPPSLRRPFLRRPVVAQAAHLTWLSPVALQDFLRLHVADQAGEPASWAKRTAWLAGRRYLRMAVSTLDLLGADGNARFFHPLIAPQFLSSLARWGGKTGLGDRTSAMTKLFETLLPTAVVNRQTKASFGGAYWRSTTESFVRRWAGGGVDAGVVDIDQLRHVWRGGTAPFATALLAQRAWLTTTVHSGNACSFDFPTVE